MVGEAEKRKRVLTNEDVDLLTETIVERLSCQQCKFSADQIVTLQSVSNNITSGKKITNKIIMYSLIATLMGAIGSGIVIAIKQVALIIISNGNIPVK